MTPIPPRELWIGNASDVRASRVIADLGIRAIVELAAEEPPAQLPRDLVACRFPLVDGPDNDPQLIDLAIRTVAALIKRRMPTLVCCGAGMSRAPAVVAAALALVNQCDAEASLRAVASSHAADVSPALWRDVRKAMSMGGRQSV